MTHPMPTASPDVERPERGPAAAGRPAGLCLIVHDDMEFRLRLAGLVRKALPALDADSVDRAAFARMTPQRIGAYVAVLLIVEFSTQAVATDSLANLVRLRNMAPLLPILVFARGGDERSAARSVKLGASDYWPIHAVKIGELGEALQQIAEPARTEGTAVTAAVD